LVVKNCINDYNDHNGNNNNDKNSNNDNDPKDEKNEYYTTGHPFKNGKQGANPIKEIFVSNLSSIR
jgi:hypothetical protein